MTYKAENHIKVTWKSTKNREEYKSYGSSNSSTGVNDRPGDFIRGVEHTLHDAKYISDNRKR
jgi:hypothetical protein